MHHPLKFHSMFSLSQHVRIVYTNIFSSGLSEESDELPSKLGHLVMNDGSEVVERSISRDSAVHNQEDSDIFDRGLPATPPGPSRGTMQSNRASASPGVLVRSPQSPHTRAINSESENNKLVPLSTGTRQSLMPDLDAILFIKMDLYPMTLEDFLWVDQNSKSKETSPKHCFHTPAAVHILSAILDGVEYIHSQGMVHRDLKPGNILLSVHNGSKHSSAGSIDLSNCSECDNSPGGQHTFITPHIGDFGLVAEIRKPVDDSPRTPRGEHVFEPTELARLAPAGSKYYLPKAPINVICPKLDVYSMGVVSFELLYKFGTKTERLIVLERLKQGVLPHDFENHVMAPGIEAMTCANRDDRWDCADTRRWLEDAKERNRRY